MSAVLEQVEYVSIEQRIPMRRVWAMPSKNTFDIPPIAALVKKYLYESKVSIDPFARNKRWATFTNDLNPETAAEYHMDSVDFLSMLEGWNAVVDLTIFDPPYSPEQMKRAYDSFGLKMNSKDALRTAGWKEEKDIIQRLTNQSGIVLCFGWDSCGMGIGRGFALEGMLVVCHGAGHHDTICTVERKIESSQPDLF
jgi:hypothetical protein